MYKSHFGLDTLFPWWALILALQVIDSCASNDSFEQVKTSQLEYVDCRKYRPRVKIYNFDY